MASSEEKKAGLYEKWLKHFTLNIMTQSFHAFLLMFVINMLGVINKLQVADDKVLNTNDSILAILSIVGMMAIIKFEKLFKELFGLQDSLAGSAKASGAQMFAGIKSAAKFGDEIKKPFTNNATAKRNMTNLGKGMGLSEDKIGHYIKNTSSAAGTAGTTGTVGATNARPTTPPLSEKTQELYNKMKNAKKNGDMDSYKDYRDHAATQMKYERATAAGGTGGGGTGTASKTPTKEEYNDSVYEHRKSQRKVLAQSAINLASVTMGMGGTDTMAEAITAANLINNPLNAAANRYIDHGENIVARKSTGDSTKFNERTISEAIKHGFEKTVGSQRNASGPTNPIKLTVKAAVSYATVPFKSVNTAVRHSKVDNVDDV